MIFILVTVFIDVLGIGIIIPILPGLIKEFAGGSTTRRRGRRSNCRGRRSCWGR